MLDKILEYLVKESRSREFRTADGKTIRGIIKDFYLTSRGVEVKFFSEKTQGLKEFNFEDVLTIDNMAPDVFLHNTAAETPAAGPLPERMVFSVSSITRLIKKKLTESFSGIWVSGEVSNFTLSAAGHMYFNLKDEQALLKVVFFSGRSRNLKFKIADGLKLEVYGALSVYEKSGAYQLLADRVIPEGKGAQQLAFEQLKEKLLKEGLFDKKHKKPLPLFPETIGIITSPTGAAFRDILRVSKEIFPRQHFILYPAAVQGSEAAPSMIRMIEIANRRAECDVLIVGRGGGSAEDLMSFNDEALARAIFRSGIPVISAVGHEIDYFICDFTADHRAATPSQAAEIISRSKYQAARMLPEIRNRLLKAMDRLYSECNLRFSALSTERIIKILEYRTAQLSLQNDDLRRRTDTALHQIYEDKKQFFLQSLAKLDALSPQKVLERGYSVVYKNKKIIKNAAELAAGDLVELRLAQGTSAAEIQ